MPSGCGPTRCRPIFLSASAPFVDGCRNGFGVFGVKDSLACHTENAVVLMGMDRADRTYEARAKAIIQNNIDVA